jgi:pimeloyl-ACP methyl ester carboxylesterase
VTPPPPPLEGTACGPLVVVVPGLGLTHYVRRLVREVERRGASAVVLDLPGYGSPGPRTTAPDVRDVGRAAASWLVHHGTARPVVLVGHSTGAQAALVAGLEVQASRDDVTVVLAGPTFAPGQRTLPGVLARVPLAYRHDGPWQLDPRELLRAGPRDLLALVRSGQRDRPEDGVAGLRLPLVLTAGRHDAFAPVEWLELLRGRAVRSPDVRVRILGGSHNNPWTHAAELATLLLGGVAHAGPPM